jgi:hypothetical protein
MLRLRIYVTLWYGRGDGFKGGNGPFLSHMFQFHILFETQFLFSAIATSDLPSVLSLRPVCSFLIYPSIVFAPVSAFDDNHDDDNYNNNWRGVQISFCLLCHTFFLLCVCPSFATASDPGLSSITLPVRRVLDADYVSLEVELLSRWAVG